MNRSFLLYAALVTACCGVTSAVQAQHPPTFSWAPGQKIRYAHYDRGAQWHHANHNWHGPYYNTQWGRPVAVIVPPTVNMQTHYSWGVGRTRMTPIHFQFQRPYVDSVSGTGLLPTPNWPQDTDQFGYYYVRGPW